MTEWEKLEPRLAGGMSRAELAKILDAIQSADEAWNIFSRARVRFSRVVPVLRELARGGWLEFSDGAPPHFSESGEKLARELGAARLPNYTCPLCNGSGVHGVAQQVFFKRFLEIFKQRPQGENPEFDQATMTPDSLARRLAWMIHSGDVSNRKVAVLGDDDLLSIALALSGLPASVTVMEIDARLCNFIAQVAQREGLSINVAQQDLSKRLPPALHGTFDTFACDPPEAEEGMFLFLEKGLSLLQPGDSHAGYFGVTTVESSMSKWARWQKHLLNQHELALTSILPPFTEYINWVGQKPLDDLPGFSTLPQHLWYRSWLYRIETLPGFTPRADFEVEFTEALINDREGYYQTFKAT
jgi:predicted methyltransferase